MPDKELYPFIEDELTEIVKKAFSRCGYNPDYGQVHKADRPDLCDYQCNGAFQAAREYRKAPIVIAKEVSEKIIHNDTFSGITVAGNGFINFKLSDAYILAGIKIVSQCKKYRYIDKPEQVILDYGGPNVAKPLHVGHLRSAIIGDAINRILSFAGNQVLGDIHLGDWGLQMGMVILGLVQKHKQLAGLENEEAIVDFHSLNITLDDLNELYPEISRQCREDKELLARAQEITFRLQQHHKGYYVLWQHLAEKSIADLKKSYNMLNITFDLWLGESSVHDLIDCMVADMKQRGFAYESEGALIIDCAEESDTMEIPPLILLTSNTSALYSTTDLATLQYRMKQYNPRTVIYITDKRQAMHFVQVFRVARKTGIVPGTTQLQHVGFGTMNGQDGKPFKTRAGGVMKLQDLISLVLEKAEVKIRKQNPNSIEDDSFLGELAAKIGIAALKFADLINKPARDYIFNPDKFCSFEGKTGAYILYANTRIKAIFRKVAYADVSGLVLQQAASEQERALMLCLLDFPARVSASCRTLQPSIMAEYCYLLANAFNGFYKIHHIKSHENVPQKESWLKLALLTSQILEICIGLLGMEPVEYM